MLDVTERFQNIGRDRLGLPSVRQERKEQELKAAIEKTKKDVKNLGLSIDDIHFEKLEDWKLLEDFIKKMDEVQKALLGSMQQVVGITPIQGWSPTTTIGTGSTTYPIYTSTTISTLPFNDADLTNLWASYTVATPPMPNFPIEDEKK